MKSRIQGFMIMDMLLGAAVSAVLFVAMIGFSIQMTDFFVGPGYITVAETDYSISPSRIQDSRKQILMTRMEDVMSRSNSVFLSEGSLSPAMVFPDGKFLIGDFSPASLNPFDLQDPTILRSELESGGLSFSDGYTVFFTGDYLAIFGVLRVSSFDTPTHRIYTVSLSIGNSTPKDLQYSFSEPLTYAQNIPSYFMGNADVGLTPYYDIILPDPLDAFSSKAARLDGTITIARDGRNGNHIILPFYP